MTQETENQEATEKKAAAKAAKAEKAKAAKATKAEKKAAAKAKTDAKKAAETEKKAKRDADKAAAKSLKKVDLTELRVRLKDANVAFGARLGAAKLVEIAKTHDISIPEASGSTGGNVIPPKYREKYGNEQSCGDTVAKELSDFTTVEEPNDKGKKVTTCSAVQLQKAADDNEIDLSKWSHLNIGMQRMNLGNVLRGRINQGKRVKIGGKVWKEQKEAKEAKL